MAGIIDLPPEVNTPNQGASGSAGSPGHVNVYYGNMINGIPSMQIEPVADIDHALQFALPLVQAGQHSILYIDYLGFKLGVNL